MNSSRADIASPLIQRQCRFGELAIDRQELNLLMGYGEKAPDTFVLNAIDHILDDLESFCTPAYGYGIYRGQRTDRSHLSIANEIFHTGPIIASSMREADHYCVFVATIGKGFDEYVQRLQLDGDMINAFVAHNLGSVLVEACVAVMGNELEEKFNPLALNISNSYCVGYCGWNLTEQKKLFSFFPAGFCGVELTPSCLMLPVKSVSGILGIGERVVKRNYSCSVCTNTSCVKNRNKTR